MKTRRIKDYFTLESNVHEEFYKFIENNNINKSKLIETLIKEFLENKKIK